MTTENHRYILAKRPDGSNFDGCFKPEIEKIDPDSIPEDHILVKTIYLSLDPAMRIWISGIKSYVEPVPLNGLMRATGIGMVIRGGSKYKIGEFVVGELGWQEYSILQENSVYQIDSPDPIYLNELGHIGQTAYWGIIDKGDIKPGEHVFVSTAAGAVGSLVCQIAKLKGCHVVGSAGSDQKVEWLQKELGIEAFNYKKVPEGGLENVLRGYFPEGIDVYFDNVGGEFLEASINLIRDFGRIVLCGAISSYNKNGEVTGPRNYSRLIFTQASMHGFLVLKYANRFKEAIKELYPLVKEGKLRSRVDISKGFASLPKTFPQLFTGENKGKLLVEISNPKQVTPSNGRL